MKRLVTYVCALLLVCAVGCDRADQKQEESSTERAQAEEADEEAEAAADDKGKEKDEKKASEDGDKDDGEPKEKAELAEDLEAGETGEYGDDFELEDDPIGLADALAAAEEGEGEPVKVEAEVEKVCKKKGCWFNIRDDEVDQPVRVRMKDYGFFVPRNLDEGARAVIEGRLKERVVPEEEAQHYANDEVEGTDKEPEKIEGDQKAWEMKITAAKMEQPS